MGRGVWLAAALLVLGCDDGDDGAAQMGAGADAGDLSAGGDMGAGGMGGAGGEAIAPQSGLWFMNIRLVDVGGLEVPFQLELDVDGAQIATLRIRAVGAARALSEPILELSGIAIVDGRFLIPRTLFTMPGAFSPTGSDVDLDLELDVEVRGPTDLCGTVVGEVISINSTLEQSTFAAVPWGTEPAAPLASCDDQPAEPLPRREDCPDLVAGRNMGFMSGGIERAFHVFLPPDHDPETPTPLVLLYHGLTANVEGILAGTDMASFVDERGFILIAPESYPDGAIEWDTASAADSPDLAFFDDLHRCAIERLGADPARIYTTGLSAGSFQAMYLGLYRAEKVATSAGFSTGLIAPVRQDAPRRPFLTAWGGPNDVAAGQNFETLTQALNAGLRALDHPVVTCNHAQDHVWLPTFTPWVLDFLLAHTLGDDLAFEALPEAFPDYCEILP